MRLLGRLKNIWPGGNPSQRIVLSVLAVGAIGIGLWTWQGASLRPRASDERPLEGLKLFGRVPDFSLVERSGEKVRRADLSGKVWVANFIYTHCPDTCPLQSAEMARLQADLAGEKDLRLVSITVDPERDTPEVLSRYAERFGAHPQRWLFLTGEKGAIYRLAQEGFRLSVVDPREGVKRPPEVSWRNEPGILSFSMTALLRFIEPASAFAHHPGPLQPFIHSSRFVLVDRNAQIRGYYHSNEPEALKRLHKDVVSLLKER